jgi:hypothetical protein
MNVRFQNQILRHNPNETQQLTNYWFTLFKLTYPVIQNEILKKQVYIFCKLVLMKVDELVGFKLCLFDFNDYIKYFVYINETQTTSKNFKINSYFYFFHFNHTFILLLHPIKFY